MRASSPDRHDRRSMMSCALLRIGKSMRRELEFSQLMLPGSRKRFVWAWAASSNPACPDKEKNLEPCQAPGPIRSRNINPNAVAETGFRADTRCPDADFARHRTTRAELAFARISSDVLQSLDGTAVTTTLRQAHQLNRCRGTSLPDHENR